MFVLRVPGLPEPVRPKVDHFFWKLFGNDRYMAMVVISLLTVHVAHVQVNKHTIASSKLKEDA